MKLLKVTFSPSQIKALLYKDLLVRWRQPWMTFVQLVFPCMAFVLLYLIRLKYGPEQVEDCQFPTRLLPTKNNVLPGFYSYICSIENRCQNTTPYEEYSKLDNAPMKPIIDIVQMFINDDNLYNAVIELPEKGNFLNTVIAIFTGGHLDAIRGNVEKVIDLVPQVEQMLNGSFDIKKLFSDRNTFVKGGNLLCGHPFPNTESIPLVNDIIYSEDFSEINDDELKAMPTKYCKRLYLDVTSSNHGKLTWHAIKPIIHGKILYAPYNEDTKSIMKFSNATFQELNRLKMLSIAVEQILVKLRTDETFQKGLESLLKLAQTPFVKSYIGDDFNLDQIESVITRIRTDPIVFDVISTIKNILECFSVDRFVPLDTEDDLRKMAYQLNNERLFYAAIHFDKTDDTDMVYKLHMDTDNTQPTIENKNRFWFPGPSRSMIRDLKYHRGFVQIKQVLDMGLIKHNKMKLRKLGVITEKPTSTTKNPLSVQIITDDDDDDDEDDDDDWFTNIDTSNTNNNTITSQQNTSLLSNFFNGINSSSKKPQVDIDFEDPEEDNNVTETTVTPIFNDYTDLDSNTTNTNDNMESLLELSENGQNITSDIAEEGQSNRQKRQGILNFLMNLMDNEGGEYEVDKLRIFTKQFPYPAFIDDDFKNGIYLAQAVQVAFFLGLIAQIQSCVRHLIWMRESRNTMIMRSMGLKPCSELTAWIIVTFAELVFIFTTITIIVYIGGILAYTKWLFIMIYLLIFGACLIAFCFMCSTFFNSATIGAVATGMLFFITFCPYIIVLMFDATLNTLQNFCINLSFTTAFSYGWSHIMRMELQQIGLSFTEVFHEGLSGDYGYSVFMIIIDTFVYIIIGCLYQRFKEDEFRFIEVQREDLDSSLGATMTNVSKIYADNKVAVSNISLSFQRNHVTCLLGRNGAGKSTIIKMLTGQVVQTAGRVILSQALTSSDDYDKVGVCCQDNILIPNLTAREHLELYAKIKLKHGYKSEVEKTLKNLGFGKYEKYQAAQLSGGYQRRLCVAIAFIASPNVVILDEPCNGVDSKARKDIWELIERLRKGRAVIFATHFLDEAEYLSDNIVIMGDGKIKAKHSAETLKHHSTGSYNVTMICGDQQTASDIENSAKTHLTDFNILDRVNATELQLQIAYDQPDPENTINFLKYLQELQAAGRISELSIQSQNLENIFKDLDTCNVKLTNGHTVEIMKPIDLKKDVNVNVVREEPLTRCEAVRHLFWKRLIHFSRNYRMLLCVIVLPAIFELLAMWFVAYRLEDDFDKTINLSRASLYPKTTQMLSLENGTEFTNDVYGQLKEECSVGMDCKEFVNSEKGFYWILDTLNDYHGKRYGGYTFNESKAMVWYNNKGYHAMMAWLNDLNSHLMQAEMNDTSYSITTYNEPWKLGYGELSTSSILRQAGDSCMAFILLIAFCLVVAVAAVYLVNERMNGEKLQQKLCGVDAATYWGVAFIWDFLVIIIATAVCSVIILCFGMPVFVDRQQIWGLIVLALFFGFACIPAVHVLEKCFTDASVAIVTIFCMNVIIPLSTMAIIVLLGVIGDTPTWDEWRYFLNRAFLIFPQHALADGLLELCKNYMVSLVFKRYDINSYKNPVNSDLLKPHLISLFVLGLFFVILNVLIESGFLYRWRDVLRRRLDCICESDKKSLEEVKIVSIQNSLKRNDQYDAPHALKVNNLSKSYNHGQYVVKNVTFAVKSGECFGLLGKNGSGKSTIFKMLSGQIQPSYGLINYFNHEISYCPQTNTLDSLLTVKECIEFYGHLRRIKDIPKLITNILEYYQLETYKDVLVKNLSGGNRRKLTVATSCCGSTSIVLMDEPTSDMDPVTRQIVYRTINDLLEEQRAIVLTSHSISEIDKICHRIGVLKDGRIITCSSPETLKLQYGGFYNVTVFGAPGKIDEIAKLIRERLPQAVDQQIYAHCTKFSIKIATPTTESKIRESGIDIPTHIRDNVDVKLHLSELFQILNNLTAESNNELRYTVNRCRLDAVFERILDNSDNGNLTNSYTDPSTYLGGPSLGYIHNGYIETETVT
ncbi:ATP-binding cassette sub-family A member 13 [Teleopsis dalmanni]|uniref:ATP-binding cassette sub-family A member 13 n=1 Tax=Teleopsis dalmanni TaxID=139649 RepID=UPI0018CE95BC|nr:ATP-binding cassette sub-family A member 13 [Teleopsis dalmanni]